MPLFQYRALRATGSEIAGELVAADERDAAARLQATGIYPIEIAAPTERRRFATRLSWGGRRIASGELVLFTRQLAALVGARVAIDRALGLIGGTPARAAARQLALELLAAVNRGESLSAACGSHAGLPRHYAM